MKDRIKEFPDRQNPSPVLEWTVLKLLNWSVSYFKDRGIEAPRASAEILLSHVLNLKRIELYVRYDQPVVSEELKRFKVLVRRRIQGEPVSYITGVKGFWSSDFKVTRDVLIPRPETEHLVEAALKIASTLISQHHQNPLRILELGTGSGAIVVSLAQKIENGLFFASDRSVDAIKVAQANAQSHGLEKQISFFSGNWFLPLKNKGIRFDLIISNPPYIPSSEIDSLQPEICRFEPRPALDGGPDGLDSLRHLIDHGHEYLSEPGKLLLEIGHDQKEAVERIAADSSRYGNINFFKDLSGINRVACMGKANRI
ncbi:MAG: peptide chain release factor N(5)-glutamine methyltransferase [Thermodesulfobacteriota bacterium]